MPEGEAFGNAKFLLVDHRRATLSLPRGGGRVDWLFGVPGRLLDVTDSRRGHGADVQVVRAARVNDLWGSDPQVGRGSYPLRLSVAGSNRGPATTDIKDAYL